MIRLRFIFTKEISEINIKPSLRVSFWLENNDNYLMPCEFVEVRKEHDKWDVEVIFLDPLQFMSDKYVGKCFFFGHPGKIIGKGVLIG